MQITLGAGNIEVVYVVREGRHGILLQPHDEQHTIGESAGSLGQSYVPKDRDVLIWLDKIESARILQDVVSMAILGMQPELLAPSPKKEGGG